ncbi:ABC transporter ATP-binding protein [Nocardia sp. X0981]
MVTGVGRDRGGWLHRLWEVAREGRRLIAGIGVVVVTGALADIAIPLAAKHALDAARIGAVDDVVAAGTVMAALALLKMGSWCGRRCLSGYLAVDVQDRLRVRALTAIQLYDGRGQDRMNSGQVISRLVSDLSAIQTFMVTVPLAGVGLLVGVFGTVVMFALSPPLCLAILLTTPLIAWAVVRERPRLQAATLSVQHCSGELTDHVQEVVAGVRVVKAFGRQEHMTRQLNTHARRLYTKRIRLARINTRFVSTISVIPKSGQVLVVCLGGWLASTGAVGLGTFLAFCTYVILLNTGVRAVSNVVAAAELTRTAVERVFQVIDGAPGDMGTEEVQGVPDGPLGVDCRSVTFGFEPRRPVLRDLDLSVRPGETVAVVGPSGAGKTLLAELLLRFYTPDSGEIAIVGPAERVCLSDVGRPELRAAIGSVFGDPFLLSDTLAANIALGRPDASQADIRRAARLACADEFIAAMPAGYDTVIGERGLTLSGGQRQRVALARALLINPRILLLDDATSAVDPITEREIFRALNATSPETVGTRDRTTIIFTQRESIAAYVDRIIRLPPPRRSVLLRAGGISGAITANGLPNSQMQQEDRHEKSASPIEFENSGMDLQKLVRPDPGFRFVRALRPVAWGIATVTLLLAVSVVIGTAFPALTRHAIDAGVISRQPDVIAYVAIAGILLAAAAWVFENLAGMAAARAGERVLLNLRIRSFAHLQRLGLDYYEREMPGHIVTRMTTDINSLSTFVQSGLGATLVGSATTSGVLALLFLVDRPLAVIVSATLFPLVVMTLWFHRTLSAEYSSARKRLSIVNACLAENIWGLRTIQAAGVEGAAASRFARLSAEHRVVARKAHRALALYFSLIIGWAELAQVVVLTIAAQRVAEGVITVGVLVSFMLYLKILFDSVQQLSQVFDGFEQARVGAKRIVEFLQTHSSTAGDAGESVEIAENWPPEVVFDRVRFRYGNSGKWVLDGVTLRIPAGTSLALVGETGSGKSTMMKLLARFYELPSENGGGPPDTGHPGSIRVAGVDIRDYRLSDYRTRLGIVSQETHLFRGTVASNIAFGRPDATLVEIEEAVRAVGASEMLSELPHGLHQPVGERGRGLSAGQCQLIALARAELIRPEVVLLDEATSVLDEDCADAVLTAGESLLRGRAGRARTALIIAHRLATAARADRIAVVAEGRIAELGTHAELVAAGGHYSRMWGGYRQRL